MENNNQSSIFVKAMFFVVLAIILTVGVTYAYFRANITGLEDSSTISIGGATLKIAYEGTETIKAENVIPGWKAKKYFNVDVTNTSGKNISYDIKLIVESNNFDTEDEINSWLEYYLYECDSADDKVCDSYLNYDWIYTQSGEQLIHSVTTNKSERTYYALEIEFPNLDEEQSQIGTDGNPLYFSGYITIDSTKEVSITQFAKDDWSTIASNIQSGNASVYKVGDEKEVEMDIDGDGVPESYTVRVANNSTPSECSTEGFSQTACGFVIEFVDIITGYNMNSTNTNVGGWPASAMYKYLNGDTSDHLTYESTNATIYSKLPSDLRSAIIDTYTVSGHGSKDTGTRSDDNFESTDKLYLLTAGEIWGDCLTSNCNDTASYPYSGSGGTTTRQLDYYQSIGVSTSSYSGAIKQGNGTNSWWWLRAAYPSNSNTFRIVSIDGGYGNSTGANGGGDVAPAFRIG